MSKSMDVHLLIAEIKKRPALWNVQLPEYKDRGHTNRLWLEVSKKIGSGVEQCKRKWKNLRDAYRAEIRRTERRVQSLKLDGHIDPQVSDCKWVYFKPMSFMSSIKRKQYPWRTCNVSHEALTPPETNETIEMGHFCDVKMELSNSSDNEAEQDMQLVNDDDEADQDQQSSSGGGIAASTLVDEEADDDADDMLFEQFKSVATPQAARRLSGTLTFGAGIGSASSPTETEILPTCQIEPTTSSPTPVLLAAAPVKSSNNGNSSSNTNSNCKCSQRAEDQVHFLEDLEREEQQLMQSTKRDITRANNVTHFGDSDYNFLVSFLPQMKRLSELKNLQFRAKMSDLMLRIMAQPLAPGCMSMTTPPCLQGHFDCPGTTTTAATATTAMMMAQQPMQLQQWRQQQQQRKQ